MRSLAGFFNHSMTYNAESRFAVPYGKLVQVAPYSGGDIRTLSAQFGLANPHLAHKKRSESLVAQIVSHCSTISKRFGSIKEILIGF